MASERVDGEAAEDDASPAADGKPATDASQAADGEPPADPDPATDSEPPADADPPADRESPVGAPVIRGDPELVGTRATEAVAFDPDDPDSVADAAETVAAFAGATTGQTDRIYVLRGAAACAALVRGVGSYKAAAERADTTVGFIRKWARVHDLPESIRRHVATGAIPPTAAKHIARLGGRGRYLLAWAVLDADLTVREVRGVAGAADGDVEAALRDAGVEPGELCLQLPTDAYLSLRRAAALSGRTPGEVVAEALDGYVEE